MTTIAVAPAPAATTTSHLPTDDLWVTYLFADSTLAAADPQATTSPAAAYQDAIYDRARLVDLRTTVEQRRDGSLPSTLNPLFVDASLPGSYAELVRAATAGPIVLITTDGSHARRLAEHVRSLGLPEVSALRGGFTAWRSHYLPVA